ncbi:Pre-mRNA-splicing factor spp2 [Dionaea muscipula]
MGGVVGMDHLNASARLMIVSDLDHTMVDHHDPENLSLLSFNALWEANYRHDSLLVFSTGRSYTLYKQLRKEKPLLTPDITIMSVGTEITYGKLMVPDEGWVEYLNQKWDRNVVLEETSKFPELTPQSETEQRPHKVSFYIQKDKAQQVMKILAERLGKSGLDVKIIYSGGTDLDILPQGAGKGQALAYLLNKFKLEGKTPTSTLVCGDSGNDAELFSIPGVYGVMVNNAQEELLHWHAENAKDNPNIIHAHGRCAAGIIEAIGHFKLGSNLSPRDVATFTDCELENVNPGHEVVKFYLFYERWRCGEVDNSAAYIANIKATCHPCGVFIHPSGAELSLHSCIDLFEKSYGDKQGKRYRVWVDRVLAASISKDAWLVRFDKWELSGEERQCCVTIALLTSKETESLDGLSWEHLHQTWLDGYAANDHTAWIL